MYSLAKLRQRLTAHEIVDRIPTTGEEVVFYQDSADGYEGWRTREYGDTHNLVPEMTNEDPAMLAMLEVAEAACVYVRGRSTSQWHRLVLAAGKFEESGIPDRTGEDNE